MTDPNPTEKNPAPIDFEKSLIIRRHDNKVYAIPLDALGQFEVSSDQLNFDETALVQTMGCYNCRSRCSSITS